MSVPEDISVESPANKKGLDLPAWYTLERLMIPVRDFIQCS